MPYSGPNDPDLPAHVKQLPPDKKRQWVHVFESCWQRHHDDGLCTRMANGVVKNEMLQLHEDGDKVIVSTVVDIDEQLELFETLMSQPQYWPEQKPYPFALRTHLEGDESKLDFITPFETWELDTHEMDEVKVRCVKKLAKLEDFAVPDETPNEYRARVRDPDDFQEIRQLFPSSDDAGEHHPYNSEGVRGIGGRLKDGEDGTKVQAYIFSKKPQYGWTPQKIISWVKEKGYTVMQSEDLHWEKGEVEFGTRKIWYYEYFLKGTETAGRLICRQIPQQRDGKEEMVWMAWLTDDDAPYVLSRCAVNEDWVPPEGVSALTAVWKRKIPLEYQFWRYESRQKRLRLRNELRKVLTSDLEVVLKFDDNTALVKTDFNVMTVKTREPITTDTLSFEDVDSVGPGELPETSKFYLMRHWWKGPYLSTGPSIEHWDLVMGDTMYVLKSNPLEGGSQAMVKKPYNKAFQTLGAKRAQSIAPGKPGNPTKKMPSWALRIDTGDAIIHKDTPELKQVEFMGEKLKGMYAFKRADTNVNLWKFEKTLEPDETLEKLSVVDGHLHITLEKIEVIGDEDNPTRVIIDGVAFSYGVWNGVYYPEEVVKDRPERMIGIPIVVGGHDVEEASGKVIDLKERDGDLHIRGVLDQPKGIKAFLEGVREQQLKGYSVEIEIEVDSARRICRAVKKYQRVAVVDRPACTVCKIGGAIAG